ncbi:CRISPR-associated endoribonuclease Cas6 [Gelria sp. Kuro-4]|uniref:CRISPR-associated endoribonuclease Cas6 n=1 Tax=Gelria sp. Kuro-4 TaxID=2796927 RepID=UPI001C7F0DB7|nr:CRISPR-associated endoribonuclease Cas6 [Gelria sp. Kuro-4]
MALKSVRVRSSDQKVLYFKDTVVKGWLGQYVFEGDPAMLQVALDCGIGAKNSQGFGCWSRFSHCRRSSVVSRTGEIDTSTNTGVTAFSQAD